MPCGWNAWVPVDEYLEVQPATVPSGNAERELGVTSSSKLPSLTLRIGFEV